MVTPDRADRSFAVWEAAVLATVDDGAKRTKSKSAPVRAPGA